MRKFKKSIVAISLLIPILAASQEKTPDRKAPDQYGRFVITFSPFARADTFLIDTQTGKVWQITKYSDLQGDPLVFKNIERIDSDSQFDSWLKTQRFKDQPTRP